MVETFEVDSGTFQQLLDAQAAVIALTHVSFVLTFRTGHMEDAVLGGSGTLVSIDDVDGVLTAAHVVRRFEREKSVGLVLTGYPQSLAHRASFDPALCKEISFHADGEPEHGPDVAFLILPREITAALKARKSFYNLSTRRDAMLKSAPARDLGFWALSGMAEEWTTIAPPQRGLPNIKSYNGRLLGPLDGARWHTRNDHDYAIIEVRYGESFEAPESFGGYSGGGLWQFIVKPSSTGPVVAKRYLMGAAFYQSDMTARGDRQIREITCHAHQSIYGALIDRVREELGSRAPICSSS